MSNISTIIKTNKDTLKLGMSGENVRLAQLAMAEKGYNLKGTGYFGNATDTAVEAIQRKAGIKVDGEIGPITANIIDKLPAASLIPTLDHMRQFGHRAEKPTWLYIVGCEPSDLPEWPPLKLGEASHVIAQDRRRPDGTRDVHGRRPEVTKPEREHTPPELASWLVELARRCQVRPNVRAKQEPTHDQT